MSAGTAQAAIMVANPVGFILGGLLVSRLFGPTRRLKLMRPLAVLAPLVLVPVLLDPPPLVVALLAALCGFAVAGMLPMANGLFVQALPNGFRARAFGVMATGVQVIQGFAVLVTGVLAERFPIPIVVGVWSAAGVVLMVVATLRWPDRQTVDDAITAASAANADPPPSGPDGPAGDGTVGGTAEPHAGDGHRRHAVT